MKKRFFTVLFLMSFNIPLHGQDIVQQASYFSPALGENRSYEVFLPDAYFTNEDEYFPVIYFLHGYGGDHTSQGFVTDAMSDLLNERGVEPAIIIKPDGSTDRLQYWDPVTGMFSNSVLLGNHEDALINDLISHVDANYRTLNTKDYRAIMGYSMGAESAVRLGLKHNELFSVAISHSSPLDYQFVLSSLDQILAEAPGNPPYTFSPMNGPATAMNFSRAAAFSPNLNRPPYQIDFILNSMGNLNQSVWERWQENDPLKLVTEMEISQVPALYFDVGEQDGLGFYPFNVSFADSLDQLGIDYIFETYPGDHSSGIPDRIPISLAFIDSVFKSNDLELQPGDINSDGVLDVMDIVIIVNAILTEDTDLYLQGDFNEDGQLNIIDIVQLRSWILS